MIGFPLQIPVEASVPRYIKLCEGVKETFDAAGQRLDIDRQVMLTISLTYDEAAVVRDWLEQRRTGKWPGATQ